MPPSFSAKNVVLYALDKSTKNAIIETMKLEERGAVICQR